MDKTNEALFKQAINEALTNKFQRMADACDEEIVCSRRHKKAMRAIVSGKTPRKPMTPMNRRVVAVLIAAAILLLAGCAIIYRDEIREFVTEIRELFVKVSFPDGDNDSQYIDEIYELTYIPEGYSLKDQRINRMRVQYVFANEDNKTIRFMQQTLDNASFSIDSENGDTLIIEIKNYTIYYQKSGNMNYYLWNDGEYSFQIYSAEELSNNELLLIIDGLRIKQ